MRILLDTGPILSLADRRDPRHAQVTNAWKKHGGFFVTSVAVVPEACYLLLKYLGADAELRFIESWRTGQMTVEPVAEKDLQRVVEILTGYHDQRFGFTDSALFAMAERLNIRQVFTFDRQHFDTYRPRHCSSWEHLLS